MLEAINEAKKSLREGNHGFGAVIVKDDSIISKTHDLEESNYDPTSHAEINAIRSASKILGKKLNGCILISTHEPCPMCSTAIYWSGIDHIAYGYSINESISQKRNRINISCEEIFDRANKKIKIDKDVCYDQCKLLYHQDVRKEINRLRNVNDVMLEKYNKESIKKRLEWFNKNQTGFDFISDDLLDSAYKLLLSKFNINESEIPIIKRSDKQILFHSKNFCPTLEACKILDLDTRYICKKYNEASTDNLVKQINNKLKFTRNYNKLRPYSDYCEEMISYEEDKINNQM
jgi:tRNA(Arg) A34 adenosine deaminase TadA